MSRRTWRVPTFGRCYVIGGRRVVDRSGWRMKPTSDTLGRIAGAPNALNDIERAAITALLEAMRRRRSEAGDYRAEFRLTITNRVRVSYTVMASDVAILPGV